MAERLGPGLKNGQLTTSAIDPSEVDRSITLKIATDAFGLRIQPADPDDSYPELRRPHAPGHQQSSTSDVDQAGRAEV